MQVCVWMEGFIQGLEGAFLSFEGLVQADGEPLASQFVPRCFGVIQKLTEEERWKYWNFHTRTWSTSEPKNNLPVNLPNCQLKIYLLLSQEFPDKEQTREEEHGALQPGQSWSLLHRRPREGP